MPSLAQFKPWSSVEQWLRSQGTSDDEIKRQKKLYWDATSQTTEMLGMAPEKLTSLQNNFLGTGEPGLLGTMWNAAKRGHLQAQLARQGTKAYIASLGKDEPQNAMDLIGPIADIAGTYKELERLPTPEVTKHVEQAKGLGDWLKAVKEDPANFLGDSIVSMLVNFAETAGPIAALTTAAGGALGSVIGPEGTVGGAALGARIGASLGVGAADLATVGTERFFNAFAKEGVDITDPDALRAALGNPEMVKKARDHALRAALPMAAFDALSAGLAGKLVGVAKTPIARTLAAGAETFGMHPALGVTGMAAGQQLSEGKIDPGQLATAAVGQIGIGGLMTGLGSIKPDTTFAVYRKAFNETDKSLPFEARRDIAFKAAVQKKFPRIEDPAAAEAQIAAEQAAGQTPEPLTVADQPIRGYETLEQIHKENAAKGYAIRAAQKASESTSLLSKTGLSNIANVIKRGFFNSDAQAYEFYNLARRVGYKITPENDPIMQLQRHQFAESTKAAFANDMNMHMKPMLDETGMQPHEVDLLIKANRIGRGDRQFLEKNPLRPEESKIVRDALIAKHGEENVVKAETAWKNFAEGPRLAMFNEAEQLGMLTPEMAAAIKNPETLDFYATFHVIDKMAEGGGGTDAPKIYEQIGTLKEVESPIHATLMKDMAYLGAISKTRAAKSLISFINDFIGQDVAVPAPKDTRGNFRNPPPGSKMRLIKFIQNNETVAYWLPEGMSKTLAEAPQEVSAVAKMYRALHDPIRKIFVDYNPGFAIYNPIKDIGTTYKQVIKGDPITGAAKLASSLVRAFPEAWRTGWSQKVGPKDVRTMELMREGALVPPTRRQYEAGDVAETGPIYDSWHKGLQAIVDSDSANVSMRQRLSAFADKLLSGPGAVGERLTKLAAFDYMDRNKGKYGWNNQEIYHAVRNYAGTPNPMLRGDWYKFTNSLFLFSNIRKNGYAASWRAYQENPASYLTKTMMFDVAPTMLKIAAAKGLLNEVAGEKLDDFYRKVSEYDKENYNIVPIGLTKSGKAVYSAIPHDHVGQAMSKEIWRASKDPVNLKNILDVVWNEFPYTLSTSTLHPVIHATMDTSEYLQGRNPYDSYRGQPVIPDKIYKAGGVDSAAYFWKHIAQTLTGGVLIQFSSDNQSDVLDELEARLNGQPFVQGETSKKIGQAIQIGIDHQRTPLLSNPIRRLIRISNYGESQFAQEATAGTAQREAAVKLDREKIIKDMLAADPTVTSYAILNELKRRKIPITNRSSLVKTIQRLRTRIYSSSMKDKAETYGGSKAQRDIVGRMG